MNSAPGRKTSVTEDTCCWIWWKSWEGLTSVQPQESGVVGAVTAIRRVRVIHVAYPYPILFYPTSIPIRILALGMKRGLKTSDEA